MNFTMVDMKVAVSPEFLAKCFWEMFAEEQVEFFEELAKIADHIDFEEQLRHVNEIPMSIEAKNIMLMIGGSQTLTRDYHDE